MSWQLCSSLTIPNWMAGSTSYSDQLLTRYTIPQNSNQASCSKSNTEILAWNCGLLSILNNLLLGIRTT